MKQVTHTEEFVYMRHTILAAACCLFLGAAGCTHADTAGTENGGSISAGQTVCLHIAEDTAAVQLADSAAAQELARRLAQGPVTYAAHDYGGFEKVGSLGFSLPADDRRIAAKAGDIMLYQGNQLVIFYGSNSWSYTPIGTITGLSQSELKHLLRAGQGNITVMLTAEKP